MLIAPEMNSNNCQNTTTGTDNQPPRLQTTPRTKQRQPRVVPIAPQTNCQLPRVHIAPVNEEEEVYTIGTTVQKKFNQLSHVGQIIKYNDDNQ